MKSTIEISSDLPNKLLNLKRKEKNLFAIWRTKNWKGNDKNSKKKRKFSRKIRAWKEKGKKEGIGWKEKRIPVGRERIALGSTKRVETRGEARDVKVRVARRSGQIRVCATASIKVAGRLAARPNIRADILTEGSRNSRLADKQRAVAVGGGRL